MIDKSVFWPMAGFGLLAWLVVHPYLAYAVWALAVAVLLQELVLLAVLPLLALGAAWRRWSNRKG